MESLHNKTFRECWKNKYPELYKLLSKNKIKTMKEWYEKYSSLIGNSKENGTITH